MRRHFVGGVAVLLGATACDKILSIEDARPGWTTGAGATGTGGTGTAGTGTGGSTGGAGGCVPGTPMACYSGPTGTQDVGICRGGTMTCKPDGSGFGVCTGEVTPQIETCGSTDDEDCSGHDCAQWATLLDVTGYAATSAAAVDNEGNVVLVGQLSEGAISWTGGSIASTGTVDGFVLKLDASGKPLWGKALGGGAQNLTIGVGLAIDGAGDIVISGKTMTAASIGGSTVGPGLFVAKLSKDDGQPVWSRSFTVNQTDPSQFELDDALPLAMTPEGDVVVGGTFTSDIDFGNGPLAAPTGFGFYGFLARLRGSDGSGTWSRALCGGTSHCGVYGVGVDTQGNILLGATFKGTFKANPTIVASLTSVGTEDAALAKLAPNGDPVWQFRIGAVGGAVGINSLAVDTNGGPIIAGSFTGPVDFGFGSVPAPSQPTAYIARFAPDKTPVWSRAFDAPFGSVNGAVSGPFMAGDFGESFSFGAGTPSISPSGGGDVFIAKFSDTGSVVWSRAFGDPGQQYLDAVALAQKGDPVLVGMTEGSIDFGTGLMKPTNAQALFVAKLTQ